MEFKKIVVKSSGGDTTSTEMNDDMLKRLEKVFNTGPIIGEARDVIYHLMRNIYVRDLILQGFGVDHNNSFKLFQDIENEVHRRDTVILEKRKTQ